MVSMVSRPLPRPPSGMPSAPGVVTGDTPAVPAIQIPKTNVDPLWSLCQWPVTVEVHGESFTFEPLPAAQWLKFMMNDNGRFDIFGILNELAPELEDFFYEKALPVHELFELVLEIISTVGARPWWVTQRLVIAAFHSWHYLGPKMIAKGGDASTLSLAAWLDVLLFQIMDNIEPEKAEMFRLQLTAEPRDLVTDEDEDPEEGGIPVLDDLDQASFLSMA